MITDLEELASFLLKYAPLIKDLYEALTMGVHEDTIKKSILDAKIAVSDAAMKADLGLEQ